MVFAATESARAARSARRRLVLADFVRRAGPALLWASAVAASLVAADRLGWTAGPGAALVLAPLLVGVLYAGVAAWTRRPTLASSAATLDRSLGLHDRLSTAIALRPKGDGFSEWAREDGERAARDADPAKVAAIRADWTWGAWPIVLAACVAGAVVVPRVEWGPSGAGADRRADAAERIAAADRIAVAAEAARTEPAVEGASSEDLAAIRELEERLRAGGGDPSQAMTRAAGRLDSIARSLEERVEGSQRAADAVRDRLVAAGAARPDEDSRPGSALEEALARGDLTSAESAAEGLVEGAPALTAEERRALADDLERLASRLQPSPRTEATNNDIPAQAPDPAERTDEGQGRQPEMPQQQDPASAPGPEPTEQATDSIRQQAAEREAQHQVEDLQRALHDAAQELREGTPPAAPPATPPRDGPKPAERESSTKPDKSAPDRSAAGEPAESPRSEPTRGPPPGGGAKPQPTPGDARGVPANAPRPSEQPGQSPSAPRAEPGPETSERPQPSEPDAESAGTGGEPRGPKPGQPPRGGRPQRGAPALSPGQPGAPDEPQPGDEPGGLRGLQRQLRDMARTREAPRDLRERAQRIRDSSRELTEQAERGTGEAEGAGRGVGDAGPAPVSRPPGPRDPVPARDEPVDARGVPAASVQERVIAEWYSERGVRPDAEPGAAMATDLRTAVRGAERAVEQHSVPARHADLVRRVFRRYAERATPP